MNISDQLKRLIALEGNIADLIGDASRLLLSTANRLDHYTPPLLMLGDIKHALRLFLNKSMGTVQLQEWADFLEMNELVDYEHGKEDKIANILFRLANPEINGPINQKTALEILSTLSDEQ